MYTSSSNLDIIKRKMKKERVELLVRGSKLT